MLALPQKVKTLMLKGTGAEIKAFLSFDVDVDGDTQLFYKFQCFARRFYPRYFSQQSAPFHYEMAQDYLRSYARGENNLNLAFRGASKTSILKLVVAFVLLNDDKHKKKFIKVLSKDGKNSRAFVTDVFNLIIEVRNVYGDVFLRDDDKKRETTMTSFTMRDGRKLASGTVGQSQRGHVQDAYRPDWLLFDDVEDRDSISSSVITQGIIESIDEALTGLALEGNWCGVGNYISDTGVIERLKTLATAVRTTPLLHSDGQPTWEVITPEKVAEYKKGIDFYGEYMCDPRRSVDKYFDVERIERDMAQCRAPDVVSGGVKYWGKYQPHHSYGLGSDHSEGIGQDSNTMCVFDFDTGKLMATHASNTMAPDLHAHECVRVAREFGNCIWAPETNNRCGGIVLATANQLNYTNLYRDERENIIGMPPLKTVGWNTTKGNKITLFSTFRTDYNDGHIKIYDVELLKEMKAYSNTDLVDQQAGLITRHFDLLMSAVIAWHTKKQAMRSSAGMAEAYSRVFSENARHNTSAVSRA